MTTGAQAAFREHSHATTAWERAVADRLEARLAATPGTLLVAECGLGVFLRRALDAATSVSRVMAVDGDPRCVDASRAATAGAARPAFFASNGVSALGYAADVFHAAVGLRGIVTEADAINAAVALAKVVRPGGWVALCAVGERSLPLFDELFAEELYARAGDDGRAALDDLRARRLSESALDRVARLADIAVEAIDTLHVTVPFRNSADVRRDPLLHAYLASFGDLERSFPGATDAALARLDTYLDGGAVDDTLEVLVLAGTVVEPESLAVDEDDVVEEQ